jgi:hypothetical protein
MHNLVIFHRDHPHLGGKVKARGNPISKKGDGNLHVIEIGKAR